MLMLALEIARNHTVHFVFPEHLASFLLSGDLKLTLIK